MQDARSLIVVISAPSGGGKTSVIQRLLSIDPNLCVAVSVTTRPQRVGEQHGKDYYFMAQEEFEKRVNHNEFAEHATIYGHGYGTLKSDISHLRANGCDILFSKDYQGMQSLKAHYEIVSIFLVPPSLEVLKQRLAGRKQDSDVVMAERLSSAVRELEYAKDYQHIVINDDFEACVRQVHAIIMAERLKRQISVHSSS